MTEKFDPRFDARFQPGYREHQGDIPTKATRPVAASPEAPIFAPKQGEELLARAGESDPEPDGNPEPHAAPEPRVEPEEPRAELDIDPYPFERTLWIVAAALIVVGVVAAYWASSLNYMGNAMGWSWSQMMQNSAWALSGPMVTVGLAAAVGLLFRRAITWKPLE